MIMGIWRDLAAFVLLAHLVTLSRGNIDERRALEEILAKNVSIVVIENKEDGPVDLEKLRNATSLTSGYANATEALNATDVVDEEELVVELEEALVSAASSGQVIMIAPPANRGNSTKSLPGPMLIIETPSKKSKSSVKEAATQKIKKRKSIITSLDQEIAQSQTRQRSGPEEYADDEDLETLGDLLAITEYEPQRIDAKRVDEEIPQVTSDQPNSILQSAKHSRPEETHYDVPKQRSPPRNYQRTNDNLIPLSTNKSTNNSFSQELPYVVTSDSRSVESDRKPTTSIPQENKVERRKPVSLSTFDEKPNSKYTEIVRGPRNSEIIIPLTTKSPSASRKTTYNEITRKNGLIGAPSTIDSTSTFIPGSSGNTETPQRKIRNFTNTAITPRLNLHSTRVPTTPVSLPSTYYPFLQQQTSFAAKTPSQPTLSPSAVPRASRRIDDYYPGHDYVTSTNGALQPLTNQPLGYLTRYNQPSLVTRQVPKPRLYPAASEYRQADVSKDSPAEKQSDEDSYEVTTPRNSGTIAIHDEYENTRLRFSSPRTTSRPPFVDYRKVYQRENLRHQPTNDYEKVHEGISEQQQVTVNQQKNHQRDNNQRRQPTVDNRNGGRSPIARTTPSYESYEGDEEEDSPAVQESEEVRTPKATSQAINGIYARSKNSLAASTTTPVYDSYEDEESEKPKSHQQRFTTIGEHGQKLTTSPYVVPTRPAYQPYNYFARTPRPVTPTSLVDNPIYQLHGVKTSSGPIAANAIHEPIKNYHERRLPTTAAPLERQTTRILPRGTATSQRIVSTTPASDSYEVSEEYSRPTTTQRQRNLNYVDHHSDKFANNVYNDKHNVATRPATIQPRKQNAEYAYNERNEPISNRYSLYQAKSVNQSPSHVSLNPERNTNSAAGRATTTAYVDDSGSNEDESDVERRYAPTVTNLKALNRRHNLEGKNLTTESIHTPDYESYEEESNVSPSGSEKLIESHTANYGNRVRPRVVEEERRHYVPSYSHAATSLLGRSGNVKTNYGGRRRDSAHVEDEEEPVESVNRADVEEAPYEDELPASSGHAQDQATHQTHAKAKKHGGGGGGGEHKHEEGGGLKHEEDHHEAHGEKGDKGYKGYHEYDKGKKGHHDKEDHDKEYDEKKGEKKKHEEEGSYHKEHHHGEKGDKEAEFAEKGEHQKGHSTKGQHVVHKKDEYEKKTEFYDESHEEDGDEKEGQYHHEHEHKKGGHEKKGHHDSAHHEDKYGEKGEHEKGHHYHEKKGHDGKDGKDQHHEHHEKYGKKGGHEEGLKWSHKKGDDGHGGGKKHGS